MVGEGRAWHGVCMAGGMCGRGLCMVYGRGACMVHRKDGH